MTDLRFHDGYRWPFEPIQLSPEGDDLMDLYTVDPRNEFLPATVATPYIYALRGLNPEDPAVLEALDRLRQGRDQTKPYA